MVVTRALEGVDSALIGQAAAGQARSPLRATPLLQPCIGSPPRNHKAVPVCPNQASIVQGSSLYLDREVRIGDHPLLS